MMPNELCGNRSRLIPERVRQVVFLGRGWSVGLAQEAALKVRESAQAWSEAYPAMEYRHGPISTAGPGTVVWSLVELPPGLAGEITQTGAAGGPERPSAGRADSSPAPGGGDGQGSRARSRLAPELEPVGGTGG